ncbi:hypothetical protein [Edaphobacter modestus]|uniref:Uncharacterized protein n=1 Tax=Edaphobacter modestus TaxID=388466 RepID=A0A4Q7YPH3_9BACT|nr:hypothetical protein [Edaphobacter modestus]RZU39330.1 hypothetical protein BDD14_0699 [Edaphobacter modestus]
MAVTPFVPVPSKAVVLGAGTTLSILGPTGVTPAATPTHIGELNDFKFDGWKTSTTNNTNFDSGQITQKLGTLFDYGTLSGTYNNIANDPGQVALLAAAKSGVAYDFVLQLPVNALAGQTTQGNSYAISAIVTEAGGFDISQTKVSQCSFTLDINSVTVTAGS